MRRGGPGQDDAGVDIEEWEGGFRLLLLSISLALVHTIYVVQHSLHVCVLDYSLCTSLSQSDYSSIAPQAYPFALMTCIACERYQCRVVRSWLLIYACGNTQLCSLYSYSVMYSMRIILWGYSSTLCLWARIHIVQPLSLRCHVYYENILWFTPLYFMLVRIHSSAASTPTLGSLLPTLCMWE